MQLSHLRGHPETAKAEGVELRAAVLQCMSRDAAGRPRELRLIQPDETVELQGGEAFFVVYAPDVLFQGEN